MTEEFLYYVWKQRLYSLPLFTAEGEKVEVIYPGERNPDEGPDFVECRIRRGTETWAGNLEIHTKTSDWYKHHHDTHPLYRHLILHVVFYNDLEGKEPGDFPTVELKNHIPEELIFRYQRILQSKDWIPCAREVQTIPPIVWHSMFEMALARRYERKISEISRITSLNHNHIAQAFYLVLAKSFGQVVNGHAFELLARSLPLNILARHSGNLLQVEALLFGQAGMLEGQGDQYFSQLKHEYKFLRGKYNLQPVSGSLWKFMRLRPANFPTLRISQFADLIHRSSGLLSKLTECNHAEEMENLLLCRASEYWDSHYRFGEAAKTQPRIAGKDFIRSLIINAVLPFVSLKESLMEGNRSMEKLEKLLSELPPENNTVLRGWAKLGILASDAFESQALIEMKNRFCNLRKCLNCRIGHHILNKNSHINKEDQDKKGYQ